MINYKLVFCETPEEIETARVVDQVIDALVEWKTKMINFEQRVDKMDDDGGIMKELMDTVDELNKKWIIFEAKITQREGGPTSTRWPFTCKEVLTHELTKTQPEYEGTFRIDPNGQGTRDDSVMVPCENGKTCVPLNETAGVLYGWFPQNQFVSLKALSNSAEQTIAYTCLPDGPCPRDNSTITISNGRTCRLDITNGNIYCLASGSPFLLGKFSTVMERDTLANGFYLNVITFKSNMTNIIKSMPLIHRSLTEARAYGTNYGNICFNTI